MGVLVKPGDSVPLKPTLRRLLPKSAVVRKVMHIQLAEAEEIAVFYDLGPDYQFEPHSRIALIRGQAVTGTFSLAKALNHPDGYSDDFDPMSLYDARELQLTDGEKVLVAAYRNIGDGSATGFLMIGAAGDRYIPIWHFGGTEAQFRWHIDGTFEVWSAEDRECTWCPHNYLISQYAFRGGRPIRTAARSSRKQYAPYPLAEHPIVSASKVPQTQNR